MHITGKLLILLVVAVAFTGFIFAARLVDARGKWMKQLQDLKVKNEKTADELDAAQLARSQAHGDLEREMLRWDRYWTDVAGQFVPKNNNTLVASVGSQAGITPNLALHAFQLGGKESSTFVGTFSATQVQPNQSALSPMFRVRSDDVAKWNGQNWRLRTVIPSAFASRIANLESELVVEDELLAKQRKNLETQAGLSDAAKEQLEDRTGELLGGGKAVPGEAGLVAKISEADDQRNASLTEVDHLRREISASLERMQRLIQENKDLAGGLPGQLILKQASLPDSPK